MFWHLMMMMMMIIIIIVIIIIIIIIITTLHSSLIAQLSDHHLFLQMGKWEFKFILLTISYQALQTIPAILCSYIQDHTYSTTSSTLYPALFTAAYITMICVSQCFTVACYSVTVCSSCVTCYSQFWPLLALLPYKAFSPFSILTSNHRHHSHHSHLKYHLRYHHSHL